MPTLFCVTGLQAWECCVFWSRWEIFSWGTDFVKKCWCDWVKTLCGNPGKALMELITPPWCLPAVLELAGTRGLHHAGLLLLSQPVGPHTLPLPGAEKKAVPKLLLQTQQGSVSQEKRTGFGFSKDWVGLQITFLETSFFFDFTIIWGWKETGGKKRFQRGMSCRMRFLLFSRDWRAPRTDGDRPCCTSLGKWLINTTGAYSSTKFF